MSKKKKIWLGILSFLPLIMGFIMVILMLKNFVGLFDLALANASAETAGNYILKDYIIIFIIAVISGLLKLIQMVVFIILSMKNDRLENNAKILYVIFLVMIPNITAVLYYLMEVTRKDKSILKKQE